MCPCTLHGQKTGTIGTICPVLGMMNIWGVGVFVCLFSMACGQLGTIGTIGTMFSTYARARGCGVIGCLANLVGKQRKGLLTRRLKLSSLSSLSSLKGVFSVEYQWFGISAFWEKIVPEKGDIVPIVPEKNKAAQNAAVTDA